MVVNFTLFICLHLFSALLSMTNMNSEYVQHLNIINNLIITNNGIHLSEYAESCSEHLENPAIINRGRYTTPLKAGYSAIIKKESLATYVFPSGSYWKSVL